MSAFRRAAEGCRPSAVQISQHNGSSASSAEGSSAEASITLEQAAVGLIRAQQASAQAAAVLQRTIAREVKARSRADDRIRALEAELKLLRARTDGGDGAELTLLRARTDGGNGHGAALGDINVRVTSPVRTRSTSPSSRRSPASSIRKAISPARERPPMEKLRAVAAFTSTRHRGEDPSDSKIVRPPRHSTIDKQLSATAGTGKPDAKDAAEASPVPQPLARRQPSPETPMRVAPPSPPKPIVRANNYEDMLASMMDVNMTVRLPSREVMQADARRLAAKLRSRDACLLNPRSNFMQYWDIATLSALAWTATVTPYEVCVMWEPSSINALWVFNWFVNMVFMVDIVLNFFLPYSKPAALGGGLVKDRNLIRIHYLTGWFLLDIVSVIPFDTILMSVDTDGTSLSMLSAVRVLRLIRLIKLTRILRASRIFSRWENRVSMPYSKRELIKWCIIVTIMLHWLACCLVMLAQFFPTLRTPELQAQMGLVMRGDPTCSGCNSTNSGYPPTGIWNDDPCAPATCLSSCELDTLARIERPTASPHELIAYRLYLVKQESWVCRSIGLGVLRAPTWHAEMWLASLYVSMLQLGGGVGSIVPENTPEYLLFLVSIILGSVTWAMVVGTICGIMATGDPHTTEFKQNMDSLNYFLEDMHMPLELRMRAREYLRNTRDLYKKLSYAELIDRLSPTLRSDVVLQMTERQLSGVEFLAHCEKEMLVELAMRLERHVFAPREVLPGGKLCILVRGVAAKAGNILVNGDVWGQDVIISSEALRDNKLARALTFVEVATLSREDLDDLLKDFPKSKEAVRRSALKVAMQRAIVVVAEYVKVTRRRAANRSQQPRSPEGSLMSAVMEASENAMGGMEDPCPILQMMTGQPIREIDANGRIFEYEMPVVSEEKPRVRSPAGAVHRRRGSILGPHAASSQDKQWELLSKMQAEAAATRERLDKLTSMMASSPPLSRSESAESPPPQRAATPSTELEYSSGMGV